MIGHQYKCPMRSLILLFSLFFFLQPASWATGVPASASGEIHCQGKLQAKMQTESGQMDANTMADKALSHSDASMADCQTACDAGCASQASLTPSITFTFLQPNLIVAHDTPSLSFHSYTESPEIRPPLA